MGEFDRACGSGAAEAIQLNGLVDLNELSVCAVPKNWFPYFHLATRGALERSQRLISVLNSIF